MRTGARWAGIVIPVLIGLIGSRSGGDEFTLRNGGTIEGTWLNPPADDTKPLRYLIRIDSGGHVTLEAAQVRHVYRPTASAAQYAERASQLADTADGHWELAEWCGQHGLTQQRQTHLLRALELDPQRAEVRWALGYSQVGGRWVTQADFLKEKGYQRYRGNWRLPQEIALLEQERRQRQGEREWLIQLRRYRQQWARGDSQDVQSKIAAIQDPLAVPALKRMLKEDPNRQPRQWYVESLGHIRSTSATAALLTTALDDRDVEVFHACVDQLARRGTPPLVRTLAEVLKDRDNQRVNRAAFILGEIGDITAISPLIEALVTTHYVEDPGSPRTTFSFGRPAAGTGPPLSAAAAPAVSSAAGMLSSGMQLSAPRPPRQFAYPRTNQQVLDALVELSGGISFGFDQQMWRNWHAVQQNRQQLTPR